MDNILLQVEQLNIEFHDHDVPERVVNHLNMELHQGEILGIVGESGQVQDSDGDRRASDAP